VASAFNEANCGRNLIEGVVLRLAKYDVVRLTIVRTIPDVMDGLVQTGLTNDERRAEGALRVHKLRRRERRGPELPLFDDEAHRRELLLHFSRREEGVVRQDEIGTIGRSEPV